MEPSVISIIPPFVVLLLGFLTRRILLSLAVGIAAASLLSAGGFIGGVSIFAKAFLANVEIATVFTLGLSSASNLLIAIFLLILGVFITLLHHSGAAKAYENFVKAKLKSKKQAEAATLMMSSCLFVDDYFSSLTVGSVMRSVTDPFKIPRAKLAFLVDSMAAPLAIICPISSWVAATVGFLKDSGFSQNLTESTLIQGSPYVVYLHILPYILYSFVVIIGSWIIVVFGLSFGKMGRHERIAERSGDLFAGSAPPLQATSETALHRSGTLLDFFLLTSVLIGSVLLGLAYSGSWVLLGGKFGLIDAFRNSSAAHGLFIAGLLAFCFQFVWMMARGLLSLGECPGLILRGIKLMFPSVMVLVFAWTLGDILRNDLKTAQYLASMFTSGLSLKWLPAMFFVGSLIIAACIGSSWGTAALMFPIAVQMYLSLTGIDGVVAMSSVPSLFPILGAVLSGAVAGDHISPISDTTIMSATSTGMNHADHVETQMGYAIPFIIVTALSFVLVGWLGSGSYLWIAYAAIPIAASLLLFALHRLNAEVVKRSGEGAPVRSAG